MKMLCPSRSMPLCCSLFYFPFVFSMIISVCIHFRGLFVPGTAGCVATLLHDAVMNPAEGKANILQHKAICL